MNLVPLVATPGSWLPTEAPLSRVCESRANRPVLGRERWTFGRHSRQNPHPETAWNRAPEHSRVFELRIEAEKAINEKRKENRGGNKYKNNCGRGEGGRERWECFQYKYLVDVTSSCEDEAIRWIKKRSTNVR